MELIQELFLPCLWGMIACIGFGLVFNIQGVGILICGLGGALGWFIYLVAQRLLGGDILPAFSGCGRHCHLLRADGPDPPLSGDGISPGGPAAPGAWSWHL